MNKYLVKLAGGDTDHNLATRLAVPIATYHAASIPFGHGLADHFANKMHSRAPEYNHFIHKRTISKMVRGNKLDVGLRGNPFGVKNKKHTDATFKGHDNVFAPKWQSRTKRDRVWATNKGSALHELGHATAYKLSGKHGTTRMGARAVGHVGSKYVPIAMLASGNRDEAKYAPAVAAAGGAAVLADEAQANFHAYKALKKYQTKAHANRYLRRFVAPQMGNYAAGHAGPIVGAALAYKLLYGKKKSKENAYKQD